MRRMILIYLKRWLLLAKKRIIFSVKKTRASFKILFFFPFRNVYSYVQIAHSSSRRHGFRIPTHTTRRVGLFARATSQVISPRALAGQINLSNISPPPRRLDYGRVLLLIVPEPLLALLKPPQRYITMPFPVARDATGGQLKIILLTSSILPIRAPSKCIVQTRRLTKCV